MFLPDGLLTLEKTNHDVELSPRIIAPDPFASDDCLNDFSPVHPFLLNTAEGETKMNPGADELSSGLNGRLRPRKSNIPCLQSSKHVRKSEGRTGQDKAKRTSAATKTPPNKTDDLSTKSESTFLCPYCDKKFASKQTLSKHVRRMHGASSKQDSFIACLFCNHGEAETMEIIRHMVETHSQLYFACLNCHTRFSSSGELDDHKVKSCETKLPYRSRLRQKAVTGSLKEAGKDDFRNDSKLFPDGHSFNGIVISCELKPSQVYDGADIEDNITTNLILPPSKSLGSSNTVIEKSAVIVLDDIQWNKRIPPNFSFHNTDADQILSRLGVVHRSPRTGESTKKDWKNLEETTQKFEKCFDTSFYSKVASNVQENLSKFLDGSFNFNPDPDSTIKTRKSKNSVLINTAEGFPILLASEQYSRNVFDRYMPRAIAPKHKWKWDNLESEKSPINPDQIKRDSHTNNCIISLVSSLDIWTQLRMRRKFEEKFGCPPLEKKTEKQTIISNELKDILESRELPTPASQVMKITKKAPETGNRAEFPACLGLAPSTSSFEPPPAVLSGEWVRPRCYVCCACGAQSRDSRAVSTHVTTQHPNAQVQHYEIVGEQLLNADILKHLYVPPSQMCNRTRPPRGFRECTKCRKSITLDDLHQHMLDCAGDTPAVRRKCRYRPFGVRRRRPRLPDNTIRKKIRKDIRTRQTRAKALMRPRPIRTEVGDAETIRKMIADLPAKRHRVLVNPTNPSLRPRIKQRPKILMKRRHSEDRNKRIKRNNEIVETRSRPISPANDAMSIKSDEDNKPLKPKVRRVVTKTPRRHEADKRTTVLTRARRPNRHVKRVEKNDTLEGVTNDAGTDSKSVIIDNASTEESPQRININTDDFKAKEHAGQGQSNSNNRDGLPGSSGQNGNSGNRCVPAQNVPLKHSIARLTADSEKHDKSVQFHHLFLIQQECNNVNQHVQSGQQLLFENEAAVLTLDKPPLHYNTKGCLDALQKSKLNKPRKGLNACIAMLKNKLVEPTESTLPAGHVSVQCGDDEPLYDKADTPFQIKGTLGNVEIITKPVRPAAPDYATSQDKSDSLGTVIQRSSNQDETSRNTTTKDKSKTTAQNSENKTETTTQISENKSEITTQKSENKSETTPQKSESKRATTTQKSENKSETTQKSENKSETTPQKSESKRATTTQKAVNKSESTQKSENKSETTTQKPEMKRATTTRKSENKSETMQKSESRHSTRAKREMNRRKTQINEDLSITLPPKTQTSAPIVTPVMESVSPKVIPVSAGTPSQKNCKQTSVESDKNKRRTKVTDIPINIQNTQLEERHHSTPKLDRPLDTSINPIAEDKPTISEHSKPNTSNQITENEKKETLTEQSNVYYLQQQTDYHTESEYQRAVIVENFPSQDFNHVPVNNRPAHASTHVESIVSIPLDLSGKITNINSTQDLSNAPNLYLLGNTYDTYETLDLSNKSHDLGYRGETSSTPIDEIVDLSIKTSHLKQMEVSVPGEDDVTDLSLKGCTSIDVPTDLTVKKKVTDVFNNRLVSQVPEKQECPPKPSVINSEKIAQSQIVKQISQLPTGDSSNKEIKATVTSADNIIVTERYIHSNEINLRSSKADIYPIPVTEKTHEKITENVPANLSCQKLAEDNPMNESSVRGSVSVFSAKTEQDANKNEENPQTNPRSCDKVSIHMQKPIYDPTLKIPQYKIRAFDNTDLSTNSSPLVATPCTLVPNYTEADPKFNLGVIATCSDRKTFKGVQDPITHSYRTAPLNASSPNIYAITNCGVTSHSSKFESTTPVYSLAKTCISVTKIESMNSTTLTNTLLSIPGTTIANTTPVYTLAGTTIGMQANYSHFVSAVPSTAQKKHEQIDASTSSQSIIQYDKELDVHKDDMNNTNLLSNVDQDPETARKIALLPKELVDVLGNMPVDHRNRLLNILPQYVSTPTSDTGLKCELSSQSESTSKLTMSPEPKENKISSTAKNKQEPESNVNAPLFMAQQENKLPSSNTGTHSNIDQTTSPLNHQNKSGDNLHASETCAIQSHQISKDEHQTGVKNVKSDVVPEDSFSTLPTNILSLKHNVSSDKVIDLTEDETVCRSELHNEPIIEVSPQVSLLVHPKRNKSNNDQTASLRAVRIKAPSARQRSIDSQLAKYNSIVPILTNKVNNNEQDNEVEKSLHINVSLNTDVSLAIQQAEVSSTQHSNKNVTAECKFPSVTSPTLQESNLDETNSSTRRLSTASKDENLKIDNIKNIKSAVKTTLVTSSVVNNEINKNVTQIATKECCSLNSDLSDTKYVRMKLDVSPGDSESTVSELKDNPAKITDSKLERDLDISELYDSPIQCSTPKQVAGNVTESPLIVLDHHIPVACEDQEDSDDDLSLAVICKQKRQNLAKAVDVPNDLNKPKKDVSSVNKKKDKKNKINVENLNAAEVSSLSNNNIVASISLDEKQGGFTETKIDEQPSMATTDENVKQKNRKLRRKNVVNYTQSNTSDVTPKLVLNSFHVAKNVEDNIRVTEGESFNTILKDDNKQSFSTSRKRSKINDDVVVTETIKEHSLEKNIGESKSKSSLARQKNKKKKRTPISHTDSDNSRTHPSSNIHEISNDDDILSSIQKVTTADKEPFDSEPANIKEIGLEEKPEGSNGENAIENVTHPIIAVPLTSCSGFEDANSMTTPLRRSRRVRSRNNSVAGEELHVDPLQETRTPLTKKQLIFSKLLLDEENNIKQSEGITGDKIVNLRNTPVSDISQSNIITECIPVEKADNDKNKSMKRKKSADLKRKCKKKKSLNTQISSEDEIVVSFPDEAKSTKEAVHKDLTLPEQPSGDTDFSLPSTSDTACVSAEAKIVHLNEDLEVPKEKRKCGDITHIEQSSQPKKIKSNVIEVSSEVQNIPDEFNAKLQKGNAIKKRNSGELKLDCVVENELNKSQMTPTLSPNGNKHEESKLNENDMRVKTCYNMPPAGRRTRSKSAVIKSVVYDPYDIDMDDMIDNTEPLRQRKTSLEYRSSINNTKQLKYSKETKNETNSEVDNMKKSPREESTPIKHTLDSFVKHDDSDSDDSSKSDIPLKKYVEDKEKKICELNETITSQRKDVENEADSDLNYNNKQSSLCDKKSRRTLGTCNADESVSQDETEQQLRSEQFMESFGFFSERKPRKSNLLATKKISETFHIIANESDDMYFGFKDKNSKKSNQSDNRKSAETESNIRGARQKSPTPKKTVKKGRKKKDSTTVTAPSYCHICKKEFRRSDNFLRHQMTLLHVSKMSEVEMKIKTVPIQEEPNYLIAYKEHLDRIKVITDKMLKRKKNSKSAPKITPLSLEEILADVNKIVREQQLSHRGLSCDEELFLDCCELLKESHKKQELVSEMPTIVKDTNNLLCTSHADNVGLDLLGKTGIDVKGDSKNDGDVDSLTAKTILESEEVRNLENDLISGLKEAANASNMKKSGIVFQQTVNDVETDLQPEFSDHFSSPAPTESQFEQLSNYEEPVELNTLKNKKYPEFKEKMYPDVEEFDMFEDKFDKIKRKCRSQAAAAKQPRLVVEPSINRKGRKKSDKKKGKKSSKKSHPSTVLTKGALKGFDGIKVSIPTSDINISAIVSPLDGSHKKKRKGNSRKRRENKNSESSCKYDSDHPLNDSSTSLKNVDVYEFMDNEDVELFEFRPSTLMERFKSITNKETPSTSKVDPVVDEADNSSVSASDGDDFVYMSDDYVCSDDETENSLMSCDVSNTKNLLESKKLASQMKKKDAVDKNAVMGKIFKNNAVRSEKKITKSKEPAKPKANLDQLFDSLLEDEPNSSMLNDESLPLKGEVPYASKYESKTTAPNKSEELTSKYDQYHIKKKYSSTSDKEHYASKYKNLSSDNDDDDESSSFNDYGPSTSKLCLKSFIGDHKSSKPGLRPSLSPPELKPVSPKKIDSTSVKQHSSSKKNERMSFLQDDFLADTEHVTNDGIKKCDNKYQEDRSPVKKMDDVGISSDYNEIGDQLTADDTGVARQRARRKCTVGKQNILAETWSSESEPDGGPPRPNSAESMASGTTRKKKGKKKDGQHTGGRRTNNRHISFKKQDNVSRVSSSIRNSTVHTDGASSSGVSDDKSASSTLGSIVSQRSEPSTSAASTSGGAGKSVEDPPVVPSTSSGASTMSSPSAGPSTSSTSVAADQAEPTFLVPAEPGTSGGVGKFRTVYYWSSDGGDEEQLREGLAREELARAELARIEQAREEREREEREREARAREREARAREEREREEHAREEEAQQQQQQHGWIVGDSHKKLVTMLAHAKGRKRNNNNDDKRHKTE